MPTDAWKTSSFATTTPVFLMTISKLRSLFDPGSLPRSGCVVLSLIGAAVAFAPNPANAFVTVNRGTDYVVTPDGGATIFFNNRFVSFTGLPIGTPTDSPPDGGDSGLSDTVINREDDVSVAGNSTRLEIVGLSLQGTDFPSLFVGLQKYLPGGNGMLSTGNMTIGESTWSSSFTINGVLVEAPAGTNPEGVDFVKTLIQTKCGTPGFTCTNFEKGPFLATNEPYTLTPRGVFTGPNLVQPGLEQNFFMTGQVIHDDGGGSVHKIDVPGPLPILGLGAAFSFSRRLRGKCRMAAKAAHK